MTYAGFPEEIHYHLFRFIAEHGRAASVEQLARACGRSEQEVKEGLDRLREMHGVVLVPGSYTFWSLHPFSLLPTMHWVTAGGRGWWANCAWCALAIGAALKQDVHIATLDAGEDPRLEFAIRDGRSSRPEFLAHFPTPPLRWWDNPFCPCVNILFFSSAARIDKWCADHGQPKGSVLTMAEIVALADRWFGDYGSPEWQRKTPAQAERIFTDLGLDRTFWTISGSFR